MRKTIPILLFVVAFGPGSTFAASKKWIVKATWYFSNLQSTKTYTASGNSKEEAFAKARRGCISSQAISSWKGYCLNAPVNVEYEQKNDCGSHWTGWISVGGGVGSPCPAGCERGEEVGQAGPRFVDFFKPQFKHKFQCYGTQAPPPPVQAQPQPRPSPPPPVYRRLFPDPIRHPWAF